MRDSTSGTRAALVVGLATLASSPGAWGGADPHSNTDPSLVRVRHLDVDLRADFDRQRLLGTATLEIEVLRPALRELVLDTRNLIVHEVASVADSGAVSALRFELGASDPLLGAPLIIELPERPTRDGRVRVRYETMPAASGLQWLPPQQTAGRRLPFLYSQSQAIHARSWIPLQDTPQVRFTYTARIRTPPSLLAVMSAGNDPDAARDGDYRFEMPEPIPAYLMALGVGDLVFRKIGPRTGVYAEPAVVEAAAYEFAEVESMLETCEKLFGPYRWGRYDLLILPPSFPWGGMENPRLSFITPTVIAGDRSAVSLIAHELAHSWSGNLVTNATWGDAWLNEGLTTYLERRIVEVLYGRDRAAMEDLLGLQSLERDMARLDEDGSVELTRLAVDLRGRDPDDGFSDVPYEKGRLFLGFLEARLGRQRLDGFLRAYFDHFAFTSVDTARFLAYLQENLLAGPGVGVSLAEVQAWIYDTGLPATAVLPVSRALDRVDEWRRRWLEAGIDAGALPGAGWSPHEWRHFLDKLPAEIDPRRLAELDRAFALTRSGNAEIAHSWLLNVVRAGYEPAFGRLEEYLVTIGRRRLVLDLYEALLDSEHGRARARQIYARARPGYQYVLQRELDTLVNNER